MSVSLSTIYEPDTFGGQNRSFGTPQTRVMGGCKQSCKSCNCNPSPLQEQSVLFLQPGECVNFQPIYYE